MFNTLLRQYTPSFSRSALIISTSLLLLSILLRSQSCPPLHKLPTICSILAAPAHSVTVHCLIPGKFPKSPQFAGLRPIASRTQGSICFWRMALVMPLSLLVQVAMIRNSLTSMARLHSYSGGMRSGNCFLTTSPMALYTLTHRSQPAFHQPQWFRILVVRQLMLCMCTSSSACTICNLQL